MSENDRERIRELSRILTNNKFDFIPAGEYELPGRDGIYARVRQQYPQLCNDGYLIWMHLHIPSENRQPEWQQSVRGVLDNLMDRANSRVSKGHGRGRWIFN
jgi:hypothetical protein